jgi:TPR repeat protein
VALSFCTTAAEHGDVTAQFILGSMHYRGHAVAQNYAEAVRWYRLAAEQGLSSAQTDLGSLYVVGEGVTQNYAEAVRWFRLAAEQGDTHAQSLLGYMYRHGHGVLQNFVLAHMWFNIAAANGAGEPVVTSRNRVASLLTQAQVGEAQALAQRCITSNYRDC